MLRRTKFLSVAAFFVFATTALAQGPVYQRNNSRNLRQLITRIENRTNVFRGNLDASYNNRRRSDRTSRQELLRATSDFQTAVSRLSSNFYRRQNGVDYVQEVLNRASTVDSLIGSTRFNTSAEATWSDIRTDLNELARAYGLTWSPTVSSYPAYPANPDYRNDQSYGRNTLTGTYRLNPSRSDDPATQADRATRSLPYRDRQVIRDRITARLEAPDQISIDRRGRSITIASSRAPQITFDADGTERVETTSNGRTIRAQATLSGDQLIVNSTGDQPTQFNVTFRPLDNGRGLEVIRRVYVEGLSMPVEVRSIYDRTSDVAQFDIYNNGSQSYPNNPQSNGTFIVRDGDQVIANLDDVLSTQTVREGDRFTLTVRQPNDIAGAQIEGHVSNVERSGRLTGRAQLNLNFDRIRMPDGRTYQFAGILESVRTPNGDTVRIDNEGTVRDDSQTNKTAQRAAIGTAVGAIIGAIAGGGKGAAIGAILGAGGGAGSVYVQGRDDLELERGTEVVIRASAPRN